MTRIFEALAAWYHREMNLAFHRGIAHMPNPFEEPKLAPAPPPSLLSIIRQAWEEAGKEVEQASRPPTTTPTPMSYDDHMIIGYMGGAPHE